MSNDSHNDPHDHSHGHSHPKGDGKHGTSRGAAGKGHDHSSGHNHAHTASRKALWWVMLLSGGYMVAEIIGGLVSGSLALLADAGHMALDTVAVMLGLFAFWISKRPPTSRKTFGYYRAEILAALANAATLIAASFFIFFEAWNRLFAPPQVQGQLMAFVAAGGLVVNAISLGIMARENRDNLNMRGVWLHLLTDALGSVAALLAAFFVWKFGWYLADPIISIVIGVLILVGAWKLLVDSVNVLLVAVPDNLDTVEIMGRIEQIPDVKGVHDLHVWAMNTGVYSLTAHLLLAKDAHHATVLRAVTKMLREQYNISHVTIQVEPFEFDHPEAHFCAPGKPFHTHETAH